MLIGVDDTDTPGTRGTGKLARWLANHLEAHGIGRALGVTRHQLLVHPAIPYTSHNSAACLELEARGDTESVFAVCRRFLLEHLVPGSDPGLCVYGGDTVPLEVVTFGQRAQEGILEIEEAMALAQRHGLHLEGLAGTGQGVIGALASVGLRASGDDGHFLELEGIRALGGVVTVREILTRTGVASIQTVASKELPGDAEVDTQDWLRPRLVRGRPVLVVEPHPDTPTRWIAVDRRHQKAPHR